MDPTQELQRDLTVLPDGAYATRVRNRVIWPMLDGYWEGDLRYQVT